MNPKEFVEKWSKIRQKEIATAQSHFNDVCRLVGHKTPLEADPKGEFFTFEEPTEKSTGDKGRADVWYNHRFIWEYKGFHKNLDKAYQQLLLYRESLGNPPLLITSDTQRFIFHTNFTDTINENHEIGFDEILDGSGVKLLKRVFNDPDSFEPARTQQQVTQATAYAFVKVAETMRKWDKETDSERLAHFIIRLLFSLFAEDMKLLPDNVFTTLASTKVGDLDYFVPGLKNLFSAMQKGGLYGVHAIPHFNGGLFDDNFIPNLPTNIQDVLRAAGKLDWSGIDPTIFGTLFERVIDESKRAQLGAHYTSKEDILLIVEPVLMQPLREEWQEVKLEASGLIDIEKPGVAYTQLKEFAYKIAGTRVLDPACGSGNFLYIALRQMLDLQKEVIQFAGRKGLDDIPLSVSPAQLYGIEINPYAHELAQTTVWIGYIQWRNENGFPDFEEPILQPLNNIEQKDAILEINETGKSTEPMWPEADVIIGNPPFLGEKKMRTELGDDYINALLKLYAERLPACDLVCYWFEKARGQLEITPNIRIGLLATQAIRGGANRKVIEKIKDTGNIFWAWADREWILDGAMVHVSMVGFDNGTENRHILDNQTVPNINPDLTSSTNISIAKRLSENKDLSFMGVTPAGPFDIPADIARKLLSTSNDSKDRLNSDVIKPYYNGTDITRRVRDIWIIDFGVQMKQAEATLYSGPFEYLKANVKPYREKSRVPNTTPWWHFTRPRPALRKAIRGFERYIGTSMVSKHHVFTWVNANIIPANLLIVIARDDDYFLGTVHSKIHELWSLGQGTQLRESKSGKRYTPTTTFETFPFPWPPGQEPGEDQDERVKNIADVARQLVNFRQPWLFPSEEILSGPKMLKTRTLTNLYNSLVYYREHIKGKHRNQTEWNNAVKKLISLEAIETLDHIHTSLDNAVLDAYGWPHNLSDEKILERLLALNLKRASGEQE
ncbi:MAG: class I SAM-dependent DNA methyltransferase [Chloroflexi bacterium]|nr:class I SAM-dependent DNA methyltransferase [Chloroflexota bacterium]